MSCVLGAGGLDLDFDIDGGSELSVGFGGGQTPCGGNVSPGARDLKVTLDSSLQSERLAVVMLDADAPSGTWLHWLRVLEPGWCAASSECTVKAGDAFVEGREASVVPYRPPTPPQGSGPHRYAVVVVPLSHSDSVLPPESRSDVSLSRVLGEAPMVVAAHVFVSRHAGHARRLDLSGDCGA